MAIYIIDDVTNCCMLDSLICGNIILLTLFGSSCGSHYAIVAGWAYGFCHFIIRIEDFDDSGRELFYNAGTMAFCIFALLALDVDLYMPREYCVTVPQHQTAHGYY